MLITIRRSALIMDISMSYDDDCEMLTFQIMLVIEYIQELWMIVAQWDRRDLCVNVK